jgi:hypothetical protein
MATYYTEADTATTQRVATLMEEQFPDLREAGVTLTVLFAQNPDGPAVKHHGVPAAAKIKINSLADRAEGKRDCTITIDFAAWKDRGDRAQEALLWHELNHPKVRRDKKTGTIKRDDLGRPKLGAVPDDYTINGFLDCARRYGPDSPEHRSLMGVVDRYRQIGLFDDWDRPERPAASGRRTAASH